jgi:hypothetical protein
VGDKELRTPAWILFTFYLLLAGCSLNLPSDTFSGLNIFPAPDPPQSGQHFSSYEQVEEYLAGQQSIDPIEGVWRFGGGEPPQDPVYEVAIIKNMQPDNFDHDFLGVIISSSNRNFNSGDLKFQFDSADANGEREGVYFMGNVADQSTIFQALQPDLIAFTVTINGKRQDVEIKRLDLNGRDY